jgi:DNA polymerase-3 subunit epsilon
VLVVGAEYSSFQDPGFALSEEVKSITGITDEMLKNQKIDWSMVDQFLQASSIIIAHNASFDRPFIDSKSSVSSKKIWGCSLKQIDWQRCGYPSQKLEVLSIYHGFFNDSHRALSDVDSLLYLLSLKNDSNEKSYLDELLNEARKTKVHVIASFASFDSKDALKSRNYRWDPQGKFWSILVNQTQMSEEVSWLEEKVYLGSFKGKCIEIPPVDQFKAK